MEFKYTNLKGVSSKADFSGLEIVANGPVELADGWQSDRINYYKPLCIYIEFRSGPEIYPPGIVLTESIEVTKEYIEKTYDVSV